MLASSWNDAIVEVGWCGREEVLGGVVVASVRVSVAVLSVVIDTSLLPYGPARPDEPRNERVFILKSSQDHNERIPSGTRWRVQVDTTQTLIKNYAYKSRLQHHIIQCP